MIPRERGKDEGLSLYTFKLFLFTHLGILERNRGLHNMLLIFKPVLNCLGGWPFIFTQKIIFGVIPL
jgi:hypothetical protein